MLDNRDISVLIVDDESIMRDTLRVILRSAEFNLVGEAADGAAGHEMAVRFKPDIILLDVVMPKTSGLEALRSIKMMEPNISIMMVTASKDHDTVAALVSEGISGYIVKPFNPKGVLTAIEKVAAQIRQNRALKV